MARVKYVGKHDAVDVAGQVVKQGGEVEVSAALAKSLCEQKTNWQPADKKPIEGSKRNGDPLDADQDGVID
jgi:hypothetical protein